MGGTKVGETEFKQTMPDGTYILKTKISIWVHFGGSFNGKCWYILWPFGVFYCHLVYFVAIWYIVWQFGICNGHLIYFSRFGMLYQEKSGNPEHRHNYSFRKF
jgi:hypothetical protein